MNAGKSAPQAGEANKPVVKKAAPVFGGGNPKCHICTKTVYKTEELKALSKVYHTACFTCSCPKGDGCGRSLRGGDYVEHDDRPYCKTCHSKLFGFKGVNVGLGASAGLEKDGSLKKATVVGASPAPAPAVKAAAPSPASSAPTRRASSNPAEEAAQMSRMHQAWIIDTLKNSPGQKCSYGHLVEVGETHQCDTVGSMMKYLKNKKVIDFKQMFLMYPMHEKEEVSLLDASILGDLSEALLDAKSQKLPDDSKPESAAAPAPAPTRGLAPAPKPVAAPAPISKSVAAPVAASPTTQQSKAAAIAAKFGGGGPKCFICTKTVYKTEETQAMGRVYHSSCFTCGGTSGNGCKKTLKIMEGYLEHSGADTNNINTPYCKSCYNKNYAPKGVNAGLAATTDLGISKVVADDLPDIGKGPAADTTTAPPSAPVVTPTNIDKSTPTAEIASPSAEDGDKKQTKRLSSLAGRMGGLDLSKVGVGMPGMGAPPAHLQRVLSNPISPAGSIADSIGTPTAADDGVLSPLAQSSTTTVAMSRASISKGRKPRTKQMFAEGSPLVEEISVKDEKEESPSKENNDDKSAIDAKDDVTETEETTSI
jgi:hypothetical protein